MMLKGFTDQLDHTIPIHLISVKHFNTWLSEQTAVIQKWLSDTGFKAEAGQFSLLPSTDGKLSFVICCVADKKNLWDVGHLPFALPQGQYAFQEPDIDYLIAWGLGAYQFTRYKKATREPAALLLPSTLSAPVSRMVQSIYLVRDLINTPTEDMGPTQLAKAAENLANAYGAAFTEIVGNDLLDKNYPAIHAVGRASDEAPRLLDIRWGNPAHPKVTLVGKGVCFDTGGLDLKPSAYMLLMKKDMGGAAHTLGLAQMIMQANLPISLRVLIPAVENAVSGNAYRPGDIIKSRKGLTIEIGNTDAEGRVILADALTEAASENPDLIIDISTLTGAARVALGTDLPALFSSHDEVADDVIKTGKQLQDPLWTLPLFEPYRDYIKSPIADLNNATAEPYAGAITAALFLQAFVPATIPWLHLDLMAWNLRPRPGRPQGGEAMGLRTLFAYLEKRYQAK